VGSSIKLGIGCVSSLAVTSWVVIVCKLTQDCCCMLRVGGRAEIGWYHWVWCGCNCVLVLNM